MATETPSDFAQGLLDKATQQLVQQPSPATTLTIGTLALASFPPSSPLDGQVLYLILPASYDPVGAKPVRWLCTYDLANSLWHVSGPALYAEVQTNEGPPGAGYGALATAGPSITVPRGGDYLVEVGFENAGAARMSYSIGAAAAVDADSAATSAAGGTYAGASRAREKTALAALTALIAQYKNVGGGFNCQNRWMRVSPLRIT